jgi:hypothetical protein
MAVVRSDERTNRIKSKPPAWIFFAPPSLGREASAAKTTYANIPPQRFTPGTSARFVGRIPTP